MGKNIRKICRKAIVIAALAGCMGCSTAKETEPASMAALMESQEETASGSLTEAQTRSENTNPAVTEATQQSGSGIETLPSETQQSNQAVETSPSMIPETTKTAPAVTSTAAAESTRSVEPVYFEGDIGEIRTQKHRLEKGNQYCEASARYSEDILGDTGVVTAYELFPQTAERYCTAEDFPEASDTILKLAKNEIYARHGRMFLDRELYEYFLSQWWYEPLYAPEEFDESCLNEYERANIDLLVSLGA